MRLRWRRQNGPARSGQRVHRTWCSASWMLELRAPIQVALSRMPKPVERGAQAALSPAAGANCPSLVPLRSPPMFAPSSKRCVASTPTGGATAVCGAAGNGGGKLGCERAGAASELVLSFGALSLLLASTAAWLGNATKNSGCSSLSQEASTTAAARASTAQSSLASTRRVPSVCPLPSESSSSIHCPSRRSVAYTFAADSGDRSTIACRFAETSAEAGQAMSLCTRSAAPSKMG